MGKPIVIIQGGQYGSEAKGLLTSVVCADRNAHICVRTGTVNAGHTIYFDGKAYKMQQLPVAWVHPNVTLVIGAGAYIHPDILAREIKDVNDATGRDVRKRLLVDYRCGLHLKRHIDRANVADRHHKMGATGKGCSEAVMEKIRARGATGLTLFKEWLEYAWHEAPGEDPEISDMLKGLKFVDTAHFLNTAYDSGHQIVIEGTQGTLLDLHLGPYPYVTHKQTQAASWMAECGLSVTLPVDLISVMRTYPIRVAGNSGPLPGEIAWAALAHSINEKLLKSGAGHLIQSWALSDWITKLAATTATMLRDAGAPHAMPYDPAMWTDAEKREYAWVASEAHAQTWSLLDPPTRDELAKLFERTTVTQKLRRIAEWDPAVAIESTMLNRPTSVALTFLNYVFPEAWGVDRVGFGNLSDELRSRIYVYLAAKEAELKCPISYVGFGPDESSTFKLYDDELGAA